MHISQGHLLLTLGLAVGSRAAAVTTSTKTVIATKTWTNMEIITKTKTLFTTKTLPTITTSIKTITSATTVFSTTCETASPTPTDVETPFCDEYYDNYYGYYDYSEHPDANCKRLPYPTPIATRDCVPSAAKCFTVTAQDAPSVQGQSLIYYNGIGKFSSGGSAMPMYIDDNSGLLYSASQPDSVFVTNWRSPSWATFRAPDNWFSANSLMQPVICNINANDNLDCTPSGRSSSGAWVHPLIGDYRADWLDLGSSTRAPYDVAVTLATNQVSCPNTC